jgi:hypothetical protein
VEEVEGVKPHAWYCRGHRRVEELLQVDVLDVERVQLVLLAEGDVLLLVDAEDVVDEGDLRTCLLNGLAKKQCILLGYSPAPRQTGEVNDAKPSLRIGIANLLQCLLAWRCWLAARV